MACGWMNVMSDAWWFMVSLFVGFLIAAAIPPYNWFTVGWVADAVMCGVAAWLAWRREH